MKGCSLGSRLIRSQSVFAPAMPNRNARNDAVPSNRTAASARRRKVRCTRSSASGPALVEKKRHTES